MSAFARRFELESNGAFTSQFRTMSGEIAKSVDKAGIADKSAHRPTADIAVDL
jgi:hypothetical protein